MFLLYFIVLFLWPISKSANVFLTQRRVFYCCDSLKKQHKDTAPTLSQHTRRHYLTLVVRTFLELSALLSPHQQVVAYHSPVVSSSTGGGLSLVPHAFLTPSSHLIQGELYTFSRWFSTHTLNAEWLNQYSQLRAGRRVPLIVYDVTTPTVSVCDNASMFSTIK